MEITHVAYLGIGTCSLFLSIKNQQRQFVRVAMK